jgi:hypothetical protein
MTLYSDAALALARTDCIYAGSHVHSKGCAVAHAYDVGHTDALASVARVTIGAGHVRVGDVLDVTHRVTVTGVGDECDVSTDDGLSHNLHAYNVTAYLVSRPDPDDPILDALRVGGFVDAQLASLRAAGYDVVKRAGA